MSVFRQKRILPSMAGTMMLVSIVELTVKIVPVSAFSGRPPSEGGLKRGSRQLPVHAAVGSIFCPGCDSLNVTSVRYGVPDGLLADLSMLFSHRVFQNTSLPLKNAR